MEFKIGDKITFKENNELNYMQDFGTRRNVPANVEFEIKEIHSDSSESYLTLIAPNYGDLETDYGNGCLYVYCLDKISQQIKQPTKHIKISHRSISFVLLEQLFKKGISSAKIIENPVWEGAYVIHTEIDYRERRIHLFYHDPVNGQEVPEGSDITRVPEVETVFLRND